jgi:hypothetical protein
MIIDIWFLATELKKHIVWLLSIDDTIAVDTIANSLPLMV